MTGRLRQRDADDGQPFFLAAQDEHALPVESHARRGARVAAHRRLQRCAVDAHQRDAPGHPLLLRKQRRVGLCRRECAREPAASVPQATQKLASSFPAGHARQQRSAGKARLDLLAIRSERRIRHQRTVGARHDGKPARQGRERTDGYRARAARAPGDAPRVPGVRPRRARGVRAASHATTAFAEALLRRVLQQPCVQLLVARAALVQHALRRAAQTAARAPPRGAGRRGAARRSAAPPSRCVRSSRRCIC